MRRARTNKADSQTNNKTADKTNSHGRRIGGTAVRASSSGDDSGWRCGRDDLADFMGEQVAGGLSVNAKVKTPNAKVVAGGLSDLVQAPKPKV